MYVYQTDVLVKGEFLQDELKVLSDRQKEGADYHFEGQ